MEHYGRAEGLSGDDVKGLYEDREGILWVTTTNGIDSFRDAAVTTFSKLEGLGKERSVGSAGRQRRHDLGCEQRLAGSHRQERAVTSIRWGKGLPGDQVTAMLEDRAGNLWIGVDDGLYLLKNGRLPPHPEPDREPLGLVVG